MDSLGLDPALLPRALELHDLFGSARPFPHIVLEGLLEPDFCRDLMAQFPVFSQDRARTEFGAHGGKATHADVAALGSAFARFDALMQSSEFLEWLSQATGIPDLLYDPEYVGGGTHDNAEGQDLDPHVDFNYHTNNEWHRRLNLILFLNDEWQADWGGCLQLHGSPWLPPEEDETATVVPAANRAVVFATTESSWHGFKRIALPPERRGLSRRSLAVYFYTKQRPPEQTAPQHGTYYVPRPLPRSIAPGVALTEAQHHELVDLFRRRDGQLQFFWRNESLLREELDRRDGEVRSNQAEIRRLQGREREFEEQLAHERQVKKQQDQERDAEIERLRDRERELEQSLQQVARSFSVRLGTTLTWPLRALGRLLGR